MNNFFLYVLFLSSFIFSSVIIKGNISDLQNNSIPNASIAILENNEGAVSDKNGNFFIKFSGLNECSIEVRHIGYQKYRKNIDCSVDQNLKISLIQESLNTNEIVVTGNRKETFVKDSPILTHVVSSQDIEKSSYSSVKDVLEMSLPNFQNSMWTHANFTSNQVKIQGLSDKNILFLIDGARVSGEFSGMLDFDMLDISNVAKIEIVDGGMSSLYGSSAIGGVVNIISKKPKKDLSYKISYMNNDPESISKTLYFGINKNIFSYVLNVVENFSDGYDLTTNDAVYSDNGGVYYNTLEKYQSLSYKHDFNLKFNNKYFLNFKYKNYIKDIFVFQDYRALEDGNFIFYKSYQHEMPKSEDNRYGLSLKVNFKESLLKLDFNTEEYIKSNYYFNYTSLIPNQQEHIYDFYNTSNQLEQRDFVNAIHENKTLNLQYNFSIAKHSIVLGFEQNNNVYNSYNIYKNQGDQFGTDLFGNIYELNVCDYPNNYTLTDCEAASIFGSVDDSKSFKTKAFYFSDTYSLMNTDVIAFSIRNVIPENYSKKTVFSFAYMYKQNQPYDIRFNYSRGFRLPSVKELYYNYLGHEPVIIGNPDLLPSVNDYFSFSVDKRVYNNSYSLEFFYNDVKNLISTSNTESNEILYVNYANVVITGFNCHYERKLNSKNKIKFLFNYTDPYSKNSNALELMSKYSLRLNYLYNLIDEQLQLSLNTKYTGRKAIENVWLEDYVILDALFILNLDFFELKIGRKNIFNYKDDRRLLVDDNGYTATEYLSSYDPGRRYVFHLSYKY